MIALVASALLLPFPAAAGITREAVLDNAAIFATHEWKMQAQNETASCSSSYVSDYGAGNTYVGIPYDWGGWVTTDEYDAYLDAGYGAGSHSWHGVLWCTVGVDCSGFVSQTWETSQKFGTSTFYQVTSEISASDLARGDAINDSGSHIVLFAHLTDAGVPVHYEANGGVVFVDADQGWSAFSGYDPIRYDSIEDGPTTGTAAEPIEIDAFPLSHLHWTAGAASDAIDSYDCAPSTDESGPEVLYHFEVATGGTLHLTVSDDAGVDVDIHVLTAASGTGCLARDDSELELELDPGEYWLSADTYVGGSEFPGPYLLSATFTGTLGESGSGDAGEGGSGQDEGSDDGLGGVGGSSGGAGSGDPGADGLLPPPGDRVSVDGVGRACASATPVDIGGGWVLAWVGVVAVALRRRRLPGRPAAENA